MIEITEEMLNGLRESVMQKLSLKRFRHTAAVELMVERLCGLFCPEQTTKMRAAALLHDVTKEWSVQEQVSFCQAHSIPVAPQDLLAPKTFHARTAAELIRADYPEFADETVISAVRWHTTGRAGMTLTEKLLYLADYIDESRTFENCVILRRYFWGAEPQKLNMEERLNLLRDTLILSYDMTIQDLLSEHSPIARDTMDARNELIVERGK